MAILYASACRNLNVGFFRCPFCLTNLATVIITQQTRMLHCRKEKVSKSVSPQKGRTICGFRTFSVPASLVSFPLRCRFRNKEKFHLSTVERETNYRQITYRLKQPASLLGLFLSKLHR